MFDKIIDRIMGTKTLRDSDLDRLTDAVAANYIGPRNQWVVKSPVDVTLTGYKIVLRSKTREERERDGRYNEWVKEMARAKPAAERRPM